MNTRFEYDDVKEFIKNITDDYLFKCEPCQYYQNVKKLFDRHLKTKKHINNIS